MLTLKQKILTQDDCKLNQARLAQAGVNPTFYKHRRKQLLAENLFEATASENILTRDTKLTDNANVSKGLKDSKKKRDKQYERTVRHARGEYILFRDRILQQRYAKYVEGAESENKTSAVIGIKGRSSTIADTTLGGERDIFSRTRGSLRNDSLNTLNSASDGNLAQSYSLGRRGELEVIRSEDSMNTNTGVSVSAQHTPSSRSFGRKYTPSTSEVTVEGALFAGSNKYKSSDGVQPVANLSLEKPKSEPHNHTHKRSVSTQSFAGTYANRNSLNSPTPRDSRSPHNTDYSENGTYANANNIGRSTGAGPLSSNSTNTLLVRSGQSARRSLDKSRSELTLGPNNTYLNTSASAKTSRSSTVNENTKRNSQPTPSVGIWSPSSLKTLGGESLDADHSPSVGSDTFSRGHTPRIAMDELSVDSSMSIFSTGVDTVLNRSSPRHPSSHSDSPHRRTRSDIPGHHESAAKTLKREQATSVLDYYSFYDSDRVRQGRDGYHEIPTFTLDTLHTAPISCIKFSRVAPSHTEKSRRKTEPNSRNGTSGVREMPARSPSAMSARSYTNNVSKGNTHNTSTRTNSASYSHLSHNSAATSAESRSRAGLRGQGGSPHARAENEYTLAIASMDGKISIVRVSDGASNCELLYTLEGHAQGVTDLAWLITGQLLVSVSLDGTFRMWQADTGSTLTTVKVGEPVLTCALCPINNNWLVLGTAMGSVRTYNCSLGKAVTGGKMDSSHGISGDIRCLCFNDSGTIVWSGSSSGVVHAFGFDPLTGTMTALMRVIIAEKTAITSMTYTPGWRLRPHSSKDIPSPMLLLSVCNNTAVLLHVMDEKTGLVKQKRTFAVAHASALVKAGSIFCEQQQRTVGSAPSADLTGSGACIASGSETGQVHIFDTASKKTVCVLGVRGNVAALVVGWNRDQTILAMGNAKGTVTFWHRTGVTS